MSRACRLNLRPGPSQKTPRRYSEAASGAAGPVEKPLQARRRDAALQGTVTHKTLAKLGLIPESKVAEIRDRTDIVAVIGEHVQLRRAGSNYLGLCPFHGEKSPSFNVSPSKQFFYCFGCQKSGDVFRFVMELEGRTFADVARDLARRSGVDIPEDSEPSPRRRAERLQEESEKARLLKLNELCARFYEVQLERNERCQRYLRERGVSDEIRARFRLGYAPSDWDALVKALQQRGVPHELSETAGLLIRREGAQLARGAPATSATHYDRFRDRAMFPLLLPPRGGSKAQGAQGLPLCDVIAFGGRVLPGGAEGDKAGAKYINSPETPLYKKGENLFGLHAARDAIRQRRQAVLVEGNFDVLALHQFGQPVTVAPMGTALTESQVRQLARLIGPDGHLVLMLDGDKAGRAATIKGGPELPGRLSRPPLGAGFRRRPVAARLGTLVGHKQQVLPPVRRGHQTCSPTIKQQIK